MNPLNSEIIVAAFNALAYVIGFCHKSHVKCYGTITPDGNSAYFFVDEPGMFTPWEIRSLYLDSATLEDVLNYRDQLMVWLDENISAWKAARVAELERELNKLIRK